MFSWISDIVNNIFGGGNSGGGSSSNNGLTTINGTSRSETIYAPNSGVIVRAKGGDDTVYGGRGKDHIMGEAGNDSLYGGDGDDTLDGGAGQDMLWGDAGSDTLIGGAGNDQLYGGADDDILYGDAGNDILFGGTGSDILNGGTGNDVYRFLDGDGHDIIENYSSNSRDFDQIHLLDVAKSNTQYIRQNNDLVIYYGNRANPTDILANSIRVMDHFTDAKSRIHQITFVDGQSLDYTQIELLVSLGGVYSAASRSSANSDHDQMRQAMSTFAVGADSGVSSELNSGVGNLNSNPTLIAASV